MKKRNLSAKRRGASEPRAGRRPQGRHWPLPRTPEPEAAPAAANGIPDRPAAILLPGRLDRLVREVVRLFRRAHLTPDEARYVYQRARQRLGLRGRPARATRLPEILSPQELEQILARAYRERGVYGLIVRTFFETGLRVGELIWVEAADVDFTERTIRVREGKGGKDRLVLFTENLSQQLRLHLDGRTRGALFESNRAAPFTPRRIQQIVKAIARQAGVAKKIHPHTYRHSMATFLRNQGVPLDVVQLLLGHENPRTTQLYAKLSMGTAREEYDRAMASLKGGHKSAHNTTGALVSAARTSKGAEGEATS